MKKKREKTGGREKGTQNKLNVDLRAKLQSIINDNIENVQSDLDQLDPMQRLQILDKLISYVLPKLQAQTLDIELSTLTDEQINQIIHSINIDENGNENENYLVNKGS